LQIAGVHPENFSAIFEERYHLDLII
jgi:hypothetical protein